jgi:hypothetical protein
MTHENISYPHLIYRDLKLKTTTKSNLHLHNPRNGAQVIGHQEG